MRPPKVSLHRMWVAGQSHTRGYLPKRLYAQVSKPFSMFRKVHIRVRDAVRQEPWLSYGTLSPVWFAGKNEVDFPTPSTPVPVRRSETAEAWEATKNTIDVIVLEKFIARYKDTVIAHP